MTETAVADEVTFSPDFPAVEAAVSRWFAEHVALGPIAYHTPAFNQAQLAKDALVADLRKLFEAPEPEATADEATPAPVAPPSPAPAIVPLPAAPAAAPVVPIINAADAASKE